MVALPLSLVLSSGGAQRQCEYLDSLIFTCLPKNFVPEKVLPGLFQSFPPLPSHYDPSCNSGLDLLRQGKQITWNFFLPAK
jgi:hypothetical protein